MKLKSIFDTKVGPKILFLSFGLLEVYWIILFASKDIVEATIKKLFGNDALNQKNPQVIIVDSVSEAKKIDQKKLRKSKLNIILSTKGLQKEFESLLARLAHLMDQTDEDTYNYISGSIKFVGKDIHYVSVFGEYVDLSTRGKKRMFLDTHITLEETARGTNQKDYVIEGILRPTTNFIKKNWSIPAFEELPVQKRDEAINMKLVELCLNFVTEKIEYKRISCGIFRRLFKLKPKVKKIVFDGEYKQNDFIKKRFGINIENNKYKKYWWSFRRKQAQSVSEFLQEHE